MAKKTDEKLFYDYCSAFASFYGRISVLDAFNIITQQNGGKYTLEEFVDYLERYQMRRNEKNIEGYFFLYSSLEPHKAIEMDIVNDCFECDCYGEGSTTKNYYVELVSKQYGKPLYVPPKDKLLKYADDSYYEITPQTEAVIQFVKKHKRKLPFRLTTGDIASEVLLPIIMDSEPLEAIECLLKWLDLPEDEKNYSEMLSTLTDLVFELHNNTRMWFLRGYTPNEMSKIALLPLPS